MSPTLTGDPLALSSEAWTALRRADPEATVFHTPEFLTSYREELGSGELRAIVADNLAACAFELEDGTLRFLGGTEVTDYQGPVGPPEARKRAAKGLMSAVVATEWEMADLGGLPQDGTWLGALAEAAHEAGLGVEEAPGGTAPFLALPGTWDAYLASLRGKQRHEIRRKERRFTEAFPEARLADATPETMAGDLDTFFEMHRASPGEKGRFMDERMEPFFRRLAGELVPQGAMRITLLRDDERVLAVLVAFRGARSLLMYNSAYDAAHRHEAPGIVLVGRVIRRAIAEGCDAIDMLKGDLDYKYRFGARPRRICRLLLRR